ncbi:hypothetical protein EX895_004795 [Sporisorium graminicola]|uniref:Uncharacterized protein n=1 Tax=Sporisorium graminicola TaxID=280036 RepID=A0A4U7KNN6_9BASI|nr:hypothetical protein EX895_004795 [Sporisorium graminicola]TKY85970.1 hypothetical protein EX895_004795 [Sporisorium graminicola]
MSTFASSSRRARASIAAPTFASTSAASSSRINDRDGLRRQSTATLSRPRSDLLQTDLSDIDSRDSTNTRSSSRLQRPLDEEFDDVVSEEDVDQEALDELLVLEQVTPRPNRRIRIESVDIDTTQTALDRFRLREQRGDKMARASFAGPSERTARQGTTTRSLASTRSRQSAPLARTSDLQPSGSRSMHTARSEISVAPTTSRRSLRSKVSAVGFVEASEDESRANTTMTRPGQRLRPSLAHPDGRLDVPTIEERCAALVINAKGVLHFYLNLYDDGWKAGSFDDMLRNWTPFESYKTNQLLAEAQYMHHFVDIEEVTRSLRASGQPRPDGFEEAMKMANCATFVHYIHQLPTDPAQYGRRNGHSITGADVVRAPLRNISELSDARRIFLRWILPFDWNLSDEVLNMLLDMSIQIFIHRLERIVEAVRAGEMAEDVARAAVSDHLIDLTSGDVVRHSLQRVKKQRGMSRAEIERMVQRYETFANVRQIDLQSMLFDYEAMREEFSFHSMSADLTGYVRDVVREVDAGMHSTTLPLIMDRLARESSVFSASDVPDVKTGSSSVIGGRNDDSSSVIAPPSQSTPKAAVQGTHPSQPFASQYAGWLEEMLDEDEAQGDSQQTRLARTSRGQIPDVGLTESQRLRELNAMMEESATDPSIDLNVASSPPRANRLGARLSAALNSSGRTSTRNQRQPSEQGVPSESSDATGAVRPRRNRDGPFDSPAKEKASRLGFDSQNRLVRRTSEGTRKNQRLLDGSAAAVRESRFDSQGEEEEDVFLDNAVQGGGKRGRRKGKGKTKATAPPADVEIAAQTTPRPRRNLRSNAAQRRQSPTEEPAADSDAVESDLEARPTARRTGSRSASRRLQLKQESLSPAKRQAQQVAGQAATTAERTRVTPSQLAKNANVAGGATGLGRGLPEGEDARSQARILSTASGRLHEDRESSDDDAGEAGDPIAVNRVEGIQAELGATRATPDEAFIGDDDQAVLDHRAALDAAIAAKKPRPGTLHFYRPEADDDAVPLGGLQDGPPEEGVDVDAIAMRNGDAVADILRSSNAVPSRRIGPYRPENGRGRPLREEPAPAVDRYSEEEVDELEDDAAADDPGSTRHRRRRNNTHVEPEGQAVRVEPYKRSNLYITGHNMTGRSRWTQPEVDCLLDSLHELARYKKVAPKFKVYTEVLMRHGVNGTRSRMLARWNNVQLKDKSRNELIRMKREGQRIPYWKRLLHPNIWKPPPVVTASGRRRDETEDVPDLGSDVEVPQEEGGEDAEDPILEVDEEAREVEGGAEAGEEAPADGVQVVIGDDEEVEED